ncbi:MAG: hypothetical protein GY822_05400 [Deltaproteobacteria bacterium]|nr:hypothetical protein [Deltaproteobacteria bacterium]
MSRPKLWMRWTLLLFSFTLFASCVDLCRPISTRTLALECGTDVLEGEIHFDAAAPFETFLAQQCMPSASADEVRDLVESVNFAEEAVWLSVRRNAIDDTRCLRSRELNEAQVCESGLKVTFYDEPEVGDELCLGRWTVAFVLDRGDLRAALDATEGGTL